MKKQLLVLSFCLLASFVANSVQADSVFSEEVVEVPREVVTPAAESAAVATEDSGWEFDITPFPIWIPDASGKFGSEGVAIGYDLDHGDILDIAKKLDWAVTGAVEARKNGWIIGVDVVAAKMSGLDLSDVNFNGDVVDTDMDITSVWANVTLGYRLYDGPLGDNTSYPYLTFDALAMASYIYLDQKTVITKVPLPILNDLVGQTVVDDSMYWWEPLGGVRVELQFSEKWSLGSKVLFGGTGAWDSRGSTDSHGDVLIGYRFSKRWMMLTGVRWKNYELKKDGIDIYSLDGVGPVLEFKASF